MREDATTLQRVHRMTFSSVYPLYVAKVERKGRTVAELRRIIEWLTGFDDADLERHLAQETSFEEFFADAHLNPASASITGVICGVRVEEIEDPVLRQVRYLDKLVDELAKGRAMEKILRSPPS